MSDENKRTPDVVDMLLAKRDVSVVDYDTLIQETQTRVWKALKKGYEYTSPTDNSDTYLRENVFAKIPMVSLFVDLVGSTQMTLDLPNEMIGIIISSFAQEMAYVIRQHDGYVLKFVGDAVIAYFVADKNSLKAADSAVNCAKSMIAVIEKGINPILNQYDYPDLQVKIGIDHGSNMIIRYGSDPEKSHVDIIGPGLNISSKIQSMAKPNQILIGADVYTRLHPETQKQFKPKVWENNEWKYHSRASGELYPVYQYMPTR